MPKPVTVVTAILCAIAGGAIGAAFTFHTVTKEARFEQSAQVYMTTSMILEQLALLDEQKVDAAKSRLNYFLILQVEMATSHQKKEGAAGGFYSQILDETAKHRKTPDYINEEAKLKK